MKKTPQPLMPTVGIQTDTSQLDVLASIQRGLVQSREGAGRTVDEVFDALENEDATSK
jgi:hypothetical protein